MRSSFFLAATLLCSAFSLPAEAQVTTQQPFPPGYTPPAETITTSAEGSTYVPMDSWIYPAMDRLHSLGYVDTAFMGIRPWTRLSIAHMLELCADRIDTDTGNDEAKSIYLAILQEVQPDIDNATELNHPNGQLESAYTVLRGISGTPLRDSFHLGQTIIDDYGRPYESGFNNYTGFSVRGEAGRFTLYYRGEYQYAPSAAGYSAALATELSQNIDSIPIASNPVQDTIPEGPIAAANNARILEATLSYHLLGHEVSFGKSDHWLGPDQGAAMLWSTNAEDIYNFQIDRVEPLRIPGLSKVTGPFRYDFFVGSLKGHTDPNDPWVHVEKVSFKPYRDLEFGFSRMVIWGGKDHEPITLHTFLKSFFSFQNVSEAEKLSRSDPGARFGNFDFDWRLPYLQKWITLYTDSFVHDDVSPISAPRRSGMHPGIYLAQFPYLHHLDLRLEGANTEPVSHSSPYPGGPINGGQFLYYETIQKQGPTNKGFLPDWVGRQGKGGQAWLTYHLSANEDIQFTYRNAKASAQFIPGGTTQNDFAGSVVKRIGKDIEVKGLVQYESWKAPIYLTGAQSDTTAAAQITWYPRQKD
ncbi:MAG TPA: capsule assembly Wzi family protein [Acidobacteriaceae bacterium]|nr:capsule assembly Wzi family protein [Acidobacteriaceae bacterium]